MGYARAILTRVRHQPKMWSTPMSTTVRQFQSRARWGRPLLGATAIALALASGLTANIASASSHREAPFITQMPKVDGTDFYMFRSTEPGRSAFVTVIANYAPLQDAYGGPNYFQMDPNALYSIHIDSNGDAKPDWTFQFSFQNTLADNKISVGGKMVSIPLVNNGARPVDSPFDGALNVRETFNIAAFRAPGTWKIGRHSVNHGPLEPIEVFRHRQVVHRSGPSSLPVEHHRR